MLAELDQGFDPFLSSIERARYGPDFPVTFIELDAIKAVIVSAQDDKIPTDAAANAIIDSVDNVPANAKSDDRRHVSATPDCRCDDHMLPLITLVRAALRSAVQNCCSFPPACIGSRR
jgi:hypothetical protein